MKSILKAILLVLLLNPLHTFSQNEWVSIDSINVFQDQDKLQNPWGGGLNTFTLKNLDYDFDGDQDLLVYEDTNQDILLWENDGKNYILIPDFYTSPVNTFIEILDINNDETPDLITSLDGKLSWYKGVNKNNTLHFTNHHYTIKLSESSINADESPSFADLDDDGDYDFILNDPSGQFIELFSNITSNTDSVNYELSDSCWGKIKYYYTHDSIVFNSDCVRYAKTNNNAAKKHIVPSLILQDFNDDDAYDLILTSSNIEYVNLLENNGSSANPEFNVSTDLFPLNEPLNLVNRPYPNKVIINGSEQSSLVCSPQYVSFRTEPHNISKLYQKDENQNYQLVTEQFLVNEMLDVGKFSIPTLWDVDADGLTDLLISNTIPGASFSVESQVYFYKNTGSIENPEFTFVEDDFLNLSTIDDTTLNIEFGDFDNDRDDDLIVGGASGKIHYLKNEEQEFVYNGVILFKDSIFQLDFGANASPAVIDYNEDGLADILVGKSSGKLELITNVGNTENGTPVFEITNNCFGNISTQIQGQPIGHSTPHFAGTLDSLNLFVGSTNGYIYQYYNINLLESENLIPNDTLKTSYTYVKPSILSTSKNKPLMLAGNNRGGASLYGYRADEVLNINTLNVKNKNIKIFPNPFLDEIYIQNNSNQASEIKIFDVNAKLILIKKITKGNNLNHINTQNLCAGFYIVQLNLQGTTEIKKIIKL